MPLRRLALAVVLAASGWVGAASAERPLPGGRFQVGATNIMCVREPCPRIGVMLLNATGKPGQRPIYSGGRPPRVEGAEGARAAVERHWSLSGCLIVEGAFLQPSVIQVDRIVGSCRR